MAKSKARRDQRAWRKLGRRPHSSIWRSFEKEFDFKPSVDPTKWPSIAEPRPSQTWSLKEFFAAPNPSEWWDDVATVNTSCHDALCAYLGKHDSVYALDWQHESFEFWPHRLSKAEAEDDKKWWSMPFPNGDYSIYVPPDLGFGFFAHPWEKSLCVFGDSFIEAFNKVKSPRISSLLRER